MNHLIRNILKVVTVGLMSTSMLLTGCQSSENADPITRSNLKLGTLVGITIHDSQDTQLFNILFDRLDAIEQHMSLNIKTSEINAINASAGIEPVQVSEDTFEVIQSSLHYGDLSKGAFDSTIGPLVTLWGIGSDNAKLPSQAEIDTKLPLIDYNSVILNIEDKTVFLPLQGMALDLGAIAKGYAADEMYRILDENKVNSAVINLGGNILVKGRKVDNTPWRVGVQNPFDTRGAYIGVVSISDQTVVTSGIYERFFELDGQRYHHILNPATGYPVNNNLASVTIITSKSIDADAYSTVLFASGLEAGLELANGSNEIMAIFVTKDKKVYVSDGVESIFELSDNNFILQ